MKVTVIGGGSTYTPELVNGFLARQAQLPITELCLMDTDAERLEIVGGFARRMAASQGAAFKVVLSDNQREAIRGANYVLTQLRVGQMKARIADEYLGRRHGLIGQETTGVGGMAKALRTIPVILSIAGDVRETTDGALLVNFTNPSGLVTEALQRFAPQVTSIGVCNAALTTQMSLMRGLQEQMGIEVSPERVVLDTLGLNHLTWYRGMTLDGQDIWPQVFAGYLDWLRQELTPEWDVRTVETLGMIPNGYLGYFYYTSQRVARQQSDWPPSRGEQVLEIEKELLCTYADPQRQTPPPALMKRGGAYYSTVAAQLLNAHFNDLGEVHVVNTRHQGAVAGWPGDWVVEMPCRVDHAGVHPVPSEALPPVCSGLVAQVKAYEQLTAEAAVTGDRRLAYQALLSHPLGPSADQVQTVLEDLLETNRAYLPQFWD
ncbi:MAG: 6-phospho-beta-glucosidase [Anaerolineaceae bacterium]|nr:6-phospho-beta-glucosidase [Anaerolineaceae bacterium]